MSAIICSVNPTLLKDEASARLDNTFGSPALTLGGAKLMSAA